MSTEHHHAYQIALKTLKERCDHLQSKLESVEEENCQLKLQISQDVRKSQKSILDADQLRLQITLLTEQKAKLSQQVQLVMFENQNLWARLSKITPGNENYETKLSLKDDLTKCLEGNVSYVGNHSDLEISKVTISPESSRESLEEISLKLNALIMDKKGVPTEFPNTIDLYVNKNPLPMENFAFSSSDNNSPMLNGFKNHIMKLKQFKQILQNNKNDLTSAITLFKNIQRNNLCSDCGKTFSINCDPNSGSEVKTCDIEDHVNDLPTLQVHEVELDASEAVPNIFEKKCPFCGDTFSGSFHDFYVHVNNHLSDDEHDITATFEVVPGHEYKFLK